MPRPFPHLRGLDKLEQDIGGRVVLVETLGFAPPSEEIDAIRKVLADPKNDHLRLSEMCAAAGISQVQFRQLYRHATSLENTCRAMTTIAVGLPDIVEDIVRLAKPHTVPCDMCGGAWGKGLRARVKCPQCKGTRKMIVDGDLKRQELVLELAGVLKRGGGVNVHVSQQTAILDVADSMGKFQRASDRVLLRERNAPPTAVLDAETSETPA